MKDTDTPKCGVKRISERNSYNGDASSLWGKDSKVGEFFSFYYFSWNGSKHETKHRC